MKRVQALALAAFLAAVQLAAQSYRTFEDEAADVRSRTGFRLGPVKVLPVLRLSDVGYDSNVLYRSREDAAVADTVATVSPELKGYWLVGHSVLLSCTENPEYDFYLKETGLRTLTNSYSPAARILLVRRLALSGDYHFLKRLRRDTSEFGAPVRDIQKGWDFRLFFETPRGSAVGFSGSVDDYRYTNPELPASSFDYARTLDRRERAASFEFYYRVFSRSSLFLTAGARDYTFLDPASTWRNAFSRQVYVGLRFPLLGRARGTIAAGYKTFIPRTEGRKRFSGLVADTDASLRAGPLGLSLAFSRDNHFSYIDTAYYFVEDRFRNGVSFNLLPFLRLEGGWQTAAWRYPEPHEVWFQGQPYLVVNRRDRNRIFWAGFAFRIAGSAGLAVNYNFYRRTSTAPGSDIARNFIGGSLVYDF